MKTIKLDQNNQEQLMAYELISKTSTSFFLTGKAGTGKTTFLKYVKENISKKKARKDLLAFFFSHLSHFNKRAKLK